MSTETVYLLLPEIVLVGVAVAIYVAGAFAEARQGWSWLAGGAIVSAGLLLWAQHGDGGVCAAVAFDPLAYYARWLALLFGILLVLLTSRPLSTPGTPEYVGSLLLVIAGLMLAGAANDLVLLFLGLELVSIPTYILLYLGRRDAASQESTVKYFFLSILASAMLLYGFCFLYGTTGSTDLSTVRTVLSTPDAVPRTFIAGFGCLALVMMLAGLSFKIAAVPFHFYAPDVYQGTTHGNAALLSVVPKAAGMIVLIRLLLVAMPQFERFSWQITLAMAVLTMTFGNVLALWQDNVRRLLAYSSIAHAGYMLIGLSVGLATVGSPMVFDGAGAVLFYLLVYAAATIGTFAALDYLGRKDAQVNGVDELAGLGRTRPAIAALLAVFMFSLAGIPPLAGFWGKLVLFMGALDVAEVGARPWFIALAIIGALNAAVAAAYYLRIVSVMYFRTPLATPAAEGGRGPYLAAVACAVLVIAIGVLPKWPIDAANQASPTAPKGPEVQATALFHR